MPGLENHPLLGFAAAAAAPLASLIGNGRNLGIRNAVKFAAAAGSVGTCQLADFGLESCSMYLQGGLALCENSRGHTLLSFHAAVATVPEKLTLNLTMGWHVVSNPYNCMFI